MDYEKEYQDACAKQTDIHEHLPVLSDLTSKCKHVTELGVGWAQSTRAFLRHDVVLHSYEYSPQPGIIDFFTDARRGGRDVHLHINDTRKIEIEETDLLFVDSLHAYEQVQEELRLHADKARKYIVFHDTTTYADNGEFGGKGIWAAVQEFVDSHPEWELTERRTNNNGLTTLTRVK
jgi:cephalosporin hydroxylase